MGAWFSGRGGGRAGGGVGARGGRHGHSGEYGYEDGANYNGSRFNPNLGTHPPHYGPGWEYDRGRRGRHGSGNGPVDGTEDFVMVVINGTTSNGSLHKDRHSSRRSRGRTNIPLSRLLKFFTPLQA